MDVFWTTGNKVQTSDGKVYKINPVAFGSFMRLYPGVDGMATNGLRYGASIELRQNFESGNSYAFTGNTASAATVGAATGFTPGGNTIGTAAASGSGNTSAETVFVRRAFTYLAADNFGIVRFGQTDGVIGLFDPCIYSSACWDAGIGNFNGGQMQGQSPSGAVAIPFAWLAQSGAEYGNTKIVYLSPQFFGVDFGVQYAPSMGNGFGNAAGASPLQGATCNAAERSRRTVTPRRRAPTGRAGTIRSASARVIRACSDRSGSAPMRSMKQPPRKSVFGVPAVSSRRSRQGAAGAANKFDNLSFLSAAAYVQFDTGVGKLTYAVDYIGGALNGQLTMRPTGGAPENAVVTGLTVLERTDHPRRRSGHRELAGRGPVDGHLAAA